MGDICWIVHESRYQVFWKSWGNDVMKLNRWISTSLPIISLTRSFHYKELANYQLVFSIVNDYFSMVNTTCELQILLVIFNKSHKNLVAKDMAWHLVEIIVISRYDSHKLFIQLTSSQHGMVIYNKKKIYNHKCLHRMVTWD